MSWNGLDLLGGAAAGGGDGPSATSFEAVARLVVEACQVATGARAGFVVQRAEDGEDDVVVFETEGLDRSIESFRARCGEVYAQGRAVLDGAPAPSALLLPIVTGGTPRGVIGLLDLPGALTTDDVRRAQSLGALAALALEAESDRRQLAEHTQTVQLLAGHSGTLLWTIAPDGRWARVSQGIERLCGFTVAEALALPPERIFTPTCLERLRERLVASPAPAASFGIELELFHKDGSTVWFESVGLARFGQRGEFQGLAGMSIDITVRKRLEEQLQHARKLEALGQLAAGVTHDFGNHLAAIALLSGLALDETPAEDPRRGTLERIRTAARDAAELTDQLLAFSRRQTLDATTIDLNEALVAHIDVIRRTLPENVRIRRRLAPHPLTIVGDSAKLQQILMNLTLNARDAMPDGGELAFASRTVELGANDAVAHDVRPGRYGELLVTDTGSGMAAEVARRAFEPFFTTKDVGRGTGLGLSTVFGVTRQLGGSVHLTTAEGRGTTVRLLLPAAGPAPVTRAAAPEALPRGTETILLIEDDAILRDTLRRVLQHLGYRVVVADSTATARAAVTRHGGTMDIVVTDVILPDASGARVIEHVAELAQGCPVLFVSGHTPEVLARVGVGPDRQILRKPFAPPELARCIRELLDGASAGQSAS